jgi:hypothetical protein
MVLTDPLTALLRVSALELLLIQVFSHVQSSPNDVGEEQERLRPGGILENDAGDADGGIASSLSGRHDELGHQSWDDDGV